MPLDTVIKRRKRAYKINNSGSLLNNIFRQTLILRDFWPIGLLVSVLLSLEFLIITVEALEADTRQ